SPAADKRVPRRRRHRSRSDVLNLIEGILGRSLETRGPPDVPEEVGVVEELIGMLWVRQRDRRRRQRQRRIVDQARRARRDKIGSGWKYAVTRRQGGHRHLIRFGNYPAHPRGLACGSADQAIDLDYTR